MPQPANQTNHQPNQPTILEQAKQGQPEAVAALINRSLQPKGLEATARREGDCLEISLKSAQVPNPKATTALIQRGMTILQAAGLRRVKVKSCRSDGMTVAWEQEFTIAAEVKINADGAARETLSNTSAQKSMAPSQSRDSVTDMITDSPLNPASSLLPANRKGQPHEPPLNQGDSMMAASSGNSHLELINSGLTNLGLTLIQAQIPDNSPEYQDVVVRFMTEPGQGERKIRCLTTLSELLQIIHKSAFTFRSVSNNPHLQYLLETIADCTVTDEQGDQVLQNMMILQPGHSWQSVNLRLVTKAYIEPAQIIAGMGSPDLHNVHQGITVDLAEATTNPPSPMIDASPQKATASWRDSDTSISEAQRSVEELTEIPQPSIDDTLEDFLNDFVPAVQTSSQVPNSQITAPPTPLEEDWRVAASTTAEIGEIVTISASPSVTDSLADFLGDFIAEPDLPVETDHKSATEVAVRTIKSIAAKGDDVFGDMWEANLGGDSITSLPAELTVNQEESRNLESHDLEVKLEASQPQAITDDLDIGWDIPESEPISTNPLMAKILAVNVDDIIPPITPSAIPDLSDELGDPLFTQLTASDISINSALDSVSEIPSIAEDDLFGDFAAPSSSSASSIMDELKIDELTVQPISAQMPPVTVDEVELRESVNDTSDIGSNDTEDVFGGWGIATNSITNPTFPIEPLESISQIPVTDVITSSNSEISFPMAQDQQLDSKITANPINAKSSSVLANEIAEIMATHKNAETQSNNTGDENLFNDFVFAIDFNPDAQSGNRNLLENPNSNWQSSDHPPTRLSVSGLSDEITL
ncbi:MAG: hypothetical protein WCO45_13845 [Pseudanabaena sp. ELA607]